MKKFVLDTNSLLRFLLNDIPAQKVTVEKLLTQAKKGEIVLFVPQIVIFEINFVLTSVYHKEKDEIIEKIESIVSVSYIEIESREIFRASVNLYKKSRVSFVDCFLFVVSKKESAELFTFDKKLKKPYLILLIELKLFATGQASPMLELISSNLSLDSILIF